MRGENEMPPDCFGNLVAFHGCSENKIKQKLFRKQIVHIINQIL